MDKILHPVVNYNKHDKHFLSISRGCKSWVIILNRNTLFSLCFTKPTLICVPILCWFSLRFEYISCNSFKRSKIHQQLICIQHVMFANMILYKKLQLTCHVMTNGVKVKCHNPSHIHMTNLSVSIDILFMPHMDFQFPAVSKNYMFEYIFETYLQLQ